MKRFLWFFVFVLMFLSALGYFLFNECALNKKVQETRKTLMSIASNAALSIDADLLLKIPLRMDADKTEEHRAIFDRLVRIKEANPSVKYIYVMTATDRPGVLQFVVDANPLPEVATAHSATSFPGDEYDVRNVPEILNAYEKPTADHAVVVDAWGATISGYAPIRNGQGRVVGILGVDMDGSRMIILQKAGRVRLLFAVLTGIFALVVLALSMKKHRVS